MNRNQYYSKKKKFHNYCPTKYCRSDGDIQQAVDKWDSNPIDAEVKYGAISQWDTSAVTRMDALFQEKRKFNDDISKWDVSNVTNMESLFKKSQFNGNISKWDVSCVTNMSYMFEGSEFNWDISGWNVSSVTDTIEMFD